jgi:FMN-dependent NADH-azoreductase
MTSSSRAKENEMKTLLQLNTSVYASNGESTRLAHEFAAAWRRNNPRSEVIVRDLASDPVPHLTAERFGAFLAKPQERTLEQQRIVDYSDALIDEIKRADVIVIGLPMYNFGIPSMLKAYFDHIARAGVTFKYTEHGPVGLMTGKKVYVVSTRGGRYAGSALDTETAYVRDFLAFIGMADIEFVYAEGLAISESDKQASLAGAKNAIQSLFNHDWRAAA